ncbi:hypothetical protein CL684_00635 [Candidatus Campbellbacteria bacterium]|nr:hypothetical protein [Candidatus Campbellbacteria bacterium]|tara:strand:+ start:1249 stop:3567 length:2319 start_codon:yes stop_codon:yes gene_type:complete
MSKENPENNKKVTNDITELESLLSSQKTNEELAEDAIEKLQNLDIAQNTKDRDAAVEILRTLPSKSNEIKLVINSLPLNKRYALLAVLPEERELKKRLIYDGSKKSWDGSNVRREGESDIPYEDYVTNYNSKFKEISPSNVNSEYLDHSDGEVESPFSYIQNKIHEEDGNDVVSMKESKNGDSLNVEYKNGTREKIQLDKEGKPFTKRLEEDEVTTHYKKDGSGKITQKDYQAGYSVVGNDPKHLETEQAGPITISRNKEKYKQSQGEQTEQPILKNITEQSENETEEVKAKISESIENNAQHLLEKSNFSEEARAYRRYMMFKETDSSQTLIDDAYEEWQKAKERALQKEEPVITAEEAADEKLRQEPVQEHVRADTIIEQENATTRAFHRMKAVIEKIKEEGVADYKKDSRYKKYYDVWNSHKDRLQKIYENGRKEIASINQQIASAQKTIEWMKGKNKKFTKPSMLMREERKLRNLEVALPALIKALGEEVHKKEEQQAKAPKENKTSSRNSKEEREDKEKPKNSAEHKEEKEEKAKTWLSRRIDTLKKHPKTLAYGVVAIAAIPLFVHVGMRSLDQKKEKINKALLEKVVPVTTSANALEKDTETYVVESISEDVEEEKEKIEKPAITHQKIEEKPEITHVKESEPFERHPSDNQIKLLDNILFGKDKNPVEYTKLITLEGMNHYSTVLKLPDGNYLLGFKSEREQKIAAEAASAINLKMASEKLLGITYNQAYTNSEYDQVSGKQISYSYVQINAEEAQGLIKNFKQ